MPIGIRKLKVTRTHCTETQYKFFRDIIQMAIHL